MSLSVWMGAAIFAVGAFAGETDFTHAANRASLDQLAAVQTFVRAAIDGGEFCSAGEREISAGMMQKLEGEIHLKLDTQAKAPLFRSLFGDGRRARECESRCRCGIYLAWLERAEAGGDRAPPSDLASDVAKWKAALAEGEKRTGAKKFARCARANREWICKSALWRGLVDDSRESMESGI